MKKWLMVSCALVTASGCAFKGDVHRMGVDFNATVANTANDVTLLNVIRAKDYLPLHFTSLGAIRGKIQLSTGAKVGSSIQGDATTAEDAAGAITRTVAEGVESFAPELSAELSTGPDFDLAVYDTQEFYQGITTSIPTETVAHLLYQGWSSDLLSYLLVERVNFRTAEDIRVTKGDPGTEKFETIIIPKGTDIRSFETAPHDEIGSVAFDQLVRCYELSPVSEKGPATTLVPVSRLAQLKLEDLKLLDGKALDLSQAVTANSGDDAKALVQRPGKSEDRLRLFPASDSKGLPCQDRSAIPGFALVAQAKPPKAEEAHEGGDGQHSVPVTVARVDVDLAHPLNQRLKDQGYPALATVKVNVEYVFRSAEGIFQFLGDYLRSGDDIAAGKRKTPVYAVDPDANNPEGRPIFDVTGSRSRGRVLVAARHLGRSYFIVDDDRETYKPTMQVLGLLQQLVNLQKKSSDKPATQSVRLLD